MKAACPQFVLVKYSSVRRSLDSEARVLSAGPINETPGALSKTSKTEGMMRSTLMLFGGE